MKKAGKQGGKKAVGLSGEEIAAMKERLKEMNASKNPADRERAVAEAIDAMPGPDRIIGRRLHAIIKASAPNLSPRLWYGMPAYSKGEDIICFFQPASKFKVRYVTLGFSDNANLDDGDVWPVTYAVNKLTTAVEAKIAALVKKAVS